MFGGSKFLSLAAFALGAISLPGAVLAANIKGSLDIGTVGFAGSSTDGGNGAYTVKGSGADIWSSTDHFHYTHFGNRTADVTVTVLVNSFTGSTNSWRKGGIMFRSHMGSQARHSMIQLTGWGVAHQSRTCDYCGSVSAHDGYDTSNVWLRLVKKGKVITSYIKRGGEYGFMRYNSIEMDLGKTFYVGLAVTSHDNAQLATMQTSNFEISEDVFEFNAAVSEIGDTGNDVLIQEYAPNMWAIQAAGTGIGGVSDSFGFFDQVATGDVIADLHLEKLTTRRNKDTAGGLMMRATRNRDSPHVSLLVTAKHGLTMFVRSTAGGETTKVNKGVWHEDVELRLRKSGNTVTCQYKHSSATKWYTIGNATASLGETYLVGQAVSSADHGDHSKLIGGPVVVTSV